MTFAKWVRLVALRESKDVVEAHETDLRIAAERERRQQEALDGIGLQWARNRGYLGTR